MIQYTWADAEREADERAGDTGVTTCIVETFTDEDGNGWLTVMPETEALAYVKERDAEIQYTAAGLCRAEHTDENGRTWTCEVDLVADHDEHEGYDRDVGLVHTWPVS